MNPQDNNCQGGIGFHANELGDEGAGLWNHPVVYWDKYSNITKWKFNNTTKCSIMERKKSWLYPH